ncbi:MAG: hypothetical protein RXP28_08660 [Nitrososphaeria archaeon]
MPKKSLKDIVEETLTKFGGKPVKDAVLFHMNRRYKVRPEDVLSKAELFIEALKDIYGPFEAPIEKELCNRLAKEYGIKYNNEGFICLVKRIRKDQKLIQG